MSETFPDWLRSVIAYCEELEDEGGEMGTPYGRAQATTAKRIRRELAEKFRARKVPVAEWGH